MCRDVASPVLTPPLLHKPMRHKHSGGVSASGRSVVGQYSEMINSSMVRVAIYIWLFFSSVL